MRAITFVLARDKNGGIGYKNRLPFRLRSDLQNFKALTTGHIVVMGRHTAESLGKPLPNRTNIVISRMGFRQEGFTTYPTPEAVIAEYPSDALYIIGGAQLYSTFLPFATQVIITEVQAELEADTWFTWQPDSTWRLNHQSDLIQEEQDEYPFVIKTYSRLGASAKEHL